MPTDRQTPLAVKVWGELACFTRPEMKVERVSYPVNDAIGRPGSSGSDFLEAAIRLAGTRNSGIEADPVLLDSPQ